VPQRIPDELEELHFALQGAYKALQISVTDPVPLRDHNSGAKMYYYAAEDDFKAYQLMKSRLDKHRKTINTFIAQHVAMSNSFLEIEECSSVHDAVSFHNATRTLAAQYRGHIALIADFRKRQKHDIFLDYPAASGWGLSANSIRPLQVNPERSYKGAKEHAEQFAFAVSEAEELEPRYLPLHTTDAPSTLDMKLAVNGWDTSYLGRIEFTKSLLAKVTNPKKA